MRWVGHVARMGDWKTKHVGSSSNTLTFIPEVHIMNIGRDTDCLARGFLLVLPSKFQSSAQITPRPLPSRPFQIHNPPTIIPFGSAQAYSELWKASSHKP
jgi:hypothetical protein